MGICYGDIFANVSFNKELSHLKNIKISGVLAGYQEHSPFGHLKIKNKEILGFSEKPLLKEPINIGFYFFKKKIFSKIKLKKKEDFETTFFPN